MSGSDAVAVVTGPDGGVEVVRVDERAEGLVDVATGELVDLVDVVVVLGLPELEGAA